MEKLKFIEFPWDIYQDACENVGAMETILIFSVAEMSQIFSSVLI